MILGAFTPDRPALGISELARRLDLTRNTTHRHVATLAKLGYLDQAEAAESSRVTFPPAKLTWPAPGDRSPEMCTSHAS